MKERTARERLTRSSPDQKCNIAETLAYVASWVPTIDSGRTRRGEFLRSHRETWLFRPDPL